MDLENAASLESVRATAGSENVHATNRKLGTWMNVSIPLNPALDFKLKRQFDKSEPTFDNSVGACTMGHRLLQINPRGRASLGCFQNTRPG